MGSARLALSGLFLTFISLSRGGDAGKTNIYDYRSEQGRTCTAMVSTSPNPKWTGAVGVQEVRTEALLLLHQATAPLLRKRVLGAVSQLGGAQSPSKPSTILHALNAKAKSSETRSARRILGKVIRQRILPNPATGAITREAVILSLESLKESSAAFPPLESTVGGILKLVKTYETMSRNKADLQKLYDRIDGIQDSLVDAYGSDVMHTYPLSATQLKALEAFDESIQSIVRDLDALAKRGKSSWRRFVLARSQSSQISELLSSLSEADGDFRRSLELDTNRHVYKIQSEAVTHHSVVQDDLRVLKTRVDDILSLLSKAFGLFAV
ncbi:hypothetical protein PENSPDRAFT_687535 [Peniophora sp. CONT]|nr:hypothetical protein PENSPDRAFT_687535 [Peniophora sp. CONT]